MTPDKRLDQIEPVLAELLLRQDKLEQKVDQLNSIALRTIKIIEKHGESIAFLLENQMALSARVDKIELRLDKIEDRLDKIETRLDRMDSRFDQIDVRLDKMETAFDEMKEMQKTMLSILLKK
jgi:DNA repair exonuclease SbcCD ATPase subunit